MRANRRVISILLLITGQALLCPLYAQQPANRDAGVYPAMETVFETPDQYRGTPVATGGFVTGTDPITISVETTRGSHAVTILGTELSPAVGDKIRVFGTLTGPRTIRSQHAFVVPQTGLWYTWSVSFLAGLWVLSRLLRHWRFEYARVRFCRRETPLSLQEVIRVGREEENA